MYIICIPYVIPISSNICLFGYCTLYDICDQVHQLALTLFRCIYVDLFHLICFPKGFNHCAFFTSPIRFSANPTLDTCNPLANSQCAPGHLLQPSGTASSGSLLDWGVGPCLSTHGCSDIREISGNFAV